jgi:GxxExxY protein
MQNQVEYKHAQLTKTIIAAYYTVYNTLGYGFLEKVYRNALAIEIDSSGFEVLCEAPIEISYRDQPIGHYFADLLVEGKVIIELKTVDRLLPEHEAQLLNYLKATPYEIGLLLNFGPKPEIRRKAFDNTRKVYIPRLPTR